LVAGWLMLPFGVDLGAARQSASEVEFTVLEKQTGKPVPCRIHVRDQAGRPQRAGDLPFWRDHFVCPGTARLSLTPGDYTYEVERGPEYAPRTGTITVKDNAAVQVRLELERRVDLSREGWWSGELHVHRPVADLELLMRAEDLHVAPVITWWNDRNEWARKSLPEDPLVHFDGDRSYHLLAGEDEREGGALHYFNLRQPLGLAGSGREYPSPMKFVAEARCREIVWIDVEKPFWWDVPVWLASGQIHSIGLANNHMCRGQMYESEAWGKPRDVERLPAPLGNGFWTQEIYYLVLNCGLRIPPSAGSASGVLPNPVGYNRVYVHVEGAFSYEKWWEGLRAGRSFVTNAPLPRVRVNVKLPGHGHLAHAEQSADLRRVPGRRRGRNEGEAGTGVRKGVGQGAPRGGFSAWVPIPNGRGRTRAAPFGVGPWDGARVAPQQGPTLRPGQGFCSHPEGVVDPDRTEGIQRGYWRDHAADRLFDLSRRKAA
jgi:hypothetical protein